MKSEALIQTFVKTVKRSRRKAGLIILFTLFKQNLNRNLEITILFRKTKHIFTFQMIKITKYSINKFLKVTKTVEVI